jgi:hypothetical protein
MSYSKTGSSNDMQQLLQLTLIARAATRVICAGMLSSTLGHVPGVVINVWRAATAIRLRYLPNIAMVLTPVKHSYVGNTTHSDL